MKYSQNSREKTQAQQKINLNPKAMTLEIIHPVEPKRVNKPPSLENLTSIKGYPPKETSLTESTKEKTPTTPSNTGPRTHSIAVNTLTLFPHSRIWTQTCTLKPKHVPSLSYLKWERGIEKYDRQMNTSTTLWTCYVIYNNRTRRTHGYLIFKYIPPPTKRNWLTSPIQQEYYYFAFNYQGLYYYDLNQRVTHHPLLTIKIQGRRELIKEVYLST